MVGNGNFGFTADITGLQTFQEQYSPLVPLMTQAQWRGTASRIRKASELEQALGAHQGGQEKRKYPP